MSTRKLEPFTIVSIIGVSFAVLACAIPFWMIISGSFTSETKLATTGYSLFPDFDFTAYKMILTGPAVLDAYLASLFITGVGTALSLAVTSGLSWAIARRLPGISRPLTIFSYLPMLFSGGLVPLYLLVTQYLHLQNSYFSVILPLLVMPFLVFVQVSAFRQLPESIFESAKIDGAGELRIFFTIALPLSKPILAVVGLFYAVHYWNDWFMALLFIDDPHKAPLPLVLQNLISNISFTQMLPQLAEAATPVYQLRLALTAVAIGPILLAYPFAQRYFVKGITLGATKG
ncbi:carbohydrate ABC transporter permease [Nonomuraea sp. SYSU D8015]|uniref:carbohydrate ABC transporter permease n=1 Tax=Nonomuraea sp. SYSU D8015 TaxID=2593644 RepID=UPI0016613A10|nr:carbohydrate ABC transporter permease [Nonomuraea sp. SYSU D8015]